MVIAGTIECVRTPIHDRQGYLQVLHGGESFLTRDGECWYADLRLMAFERIFSEEEAGPS